MTVVSYSYEALDATGKTVKGTMEVETADQVAAALVARRLTPTSINKAGTGLNREIKLPSISKRTGVKDLAVLTRQFASMTASGLSILRALAILEDQTTKPGLKEALSKTRADVRHGAPLSTALGNHPDHFPPLMVNMVKAGETGGFLDDAMSRIAMMYEADAQLKQKIKSAMMYPLVVACFSLLMGAAVIIFIVPIFERMFAQFDSELPLPTQILVTISNNIVWLLPLTIVAIVLGITVFRKSYRHNEQFRYSVDSFKLKAPIVGSIFRKIALARWSRNLATLLHVGVPALQALDVVGGTTGNEVISRAMEDVKSAIRAGRSMHEPIAANTVFPPMIAQMVEVGEETGQVTDMLDKAADYYDHEVKAATDGLTSTLEPLMVVFLGGMIGAMVVALYLPMFSIYGSMA